MTDKPDPLNAAYRERAHLVALLAAEHPSHIGHNDPNAPDWAVVTIELPTGQACWHIAPADMDLFAHVPPTPHYARGWDGHSTDEKYQRIRELAADTYTCRVAGTEAFLAAVEQHEAEQPAAEQDGDEAAGRVTAFCDALDHYGDDGNPIASEHNPDGDPDTALYLTLTKQDLRAVLANGKRLAARVAELEAAKAPCCNGPHAGWIHTAECAAPQQPARDTADGGAE
ncbi:MAG: hypothetical protein HOW97_17045 [Catenulispora sp.]|nr:hypothetical protein [Catenulispora sp.]